MEVQKFKKLTKGRYKIFFKNEESLVLYEDIIIKYNLLCDKSISVKKLEMILKDNLYYEAYSFCVLSISKRLKTKKELVSLLEFKGYDNKIINDVINKLIDNRLINDSTYLQAFINDKINFTDDGPIKIKRQLSDVGIYGEDVDIYLSNIDNAIWANRINKICNKKIKMNKNKSGYALKNKIYLDLINAGYDSSMINDAVGSIEVKDDKIYEKEKEKAYKKYSKRFNGEKLDYYVNQYLFSKGFRK